MQPLRTLCRKTLAPPKGDDPKVLSNTDSSSGLWEMQGSLHRVWINVSASSGLWNRRHTGMYAMLERKQGNGNKNSQLKSERTELCRAQRLVVQAADDPAPLGGQKSWNLLPWQCSEFFDWPVCLCSFPVWWWHCPLGQLNSFPFKTGSEACGFPGFCTVFTAGFYVLQIWGGFKGCRPGFEFL